MNSPDEIFKHGISPSMVDKWICKRAWYNHYIRGWRKKDSPFLYFGSGWDHFLNSWYDPQKPERNVDKLKEKFKEDFPIEKNLETKYISVTQDQGLRGIELYGQVYNPDTEPFKVIETQKDMEVEIEGLNLPLHVIIDGQIEYRDGLWVLENKTTSKKDLKQYLLDWQSIVYPIALAKVRNRKVEGVFFNIFLTHKVVKEKNFLRDDMVGCKTEDQLKYGWEQFTNIANEMITYVKENWQDIEAFPQVRNKMICHRGSCVYRDVCDSNDNARLWNGEVHNYEKTET